MTAWYAFKVTFLLIIQLSVCSCHWKKYMHDKQCSMILLNNCCSWLQGALPFLNIVSLAPWIPLWVVAAFVGRPSNPIPMLIMRVSSYTIFASL